MKTAKVNTSYAPTFRIKLGSGFVLLFAFIYFFDESGFLAALFPTVLVHELGHVISMLFFGAYPTQLKAAFSGFSIDYTGNMIERQEMLTALAGPVFGLVFSFMCARLGRMWNSEYLLMCAGLGFILNSFNFLPAEPLDGGRVLSFALQNTLGSEKAGPIVRISGMLTSFLLLVSGMYFISVGYGFSLFLAGIWLFILQQNKTCK
ncbi:MAG: hypothetical protein EOM14_13215 [Clostridia bacterium]|nr:hypothetical protein [Clostridia bacterium]